MSDPLPTPAPAPGITSLSTLLSTLTTTLRPSTYVFTTLSHTTPFPPSLPLSSIQCLFREQEGLTLILELEVAENHGLEYAFPCKMITLNVQSSLEAVGLMAVVSETLAERGMGVNPVSGYWHDHLFVPVGREEEAVRILGELEEKGKEIGDKAGREACA
jgi:hypothetical protein